MKDFIHSIITHPIESLSALGLVALVAAHLFRPTPTVSENPQEKLGEVQKALEKKVK